MARREKTSTYLFCPSAASLETSELLVQGEKVSCQKSPAAITKAPKKLNHTFYGYQFFMSRKKGRARRQAGRRRHLFTVDYAFGALSHQGRE